VAGRLSLQIKLICNANRLDHVTDSFDFHCLPASSWCFQRRRAALHNLSIYHTKITFAEMPKHGSGVYNGRVAALEIPFHHSKSEHQIPTFIPQLPNLTA
jgi:hypothetical protein